MIQKPSRKNVLSGAVEILTGIGEDLGREGLRGTPERVAKMYVDELTIGYHQDVGDLFTTFEAGTYDQMVVVLNTGFYSLCEHHLLPFFGNVHVAYVPSGRIVGLSKIPRLVNLYARRLQVQERLTDQIAATLESYLNPQGVIVVVEARHMCMEMRGVHARGSMTTTSSISGVFRKPEVRAEFFGILQLGRTEIV